MQPDCCHSCGHAQTQLVRTIQVNGKNLVWWQCEACQKNAGGSAQWIRFTGTLDDIPVVADYSRTRPPCCRCGAWGTELHHFAPSKIFGPEAELWPTAFLCPTCHTLWHQLVTPTLNRQQAS